MRTEEQKEKARIYARQHRLENIEKYRQKAKEKYQKNREQVKELNRKRKHDNPARWLLWIATARAKKEKFRMYDNG